MQGLYGHKEIIIISDDSEEEEQENQELPIEEEPIEEEEDQEEEEEYDQEEDEEEPIEEEEPQPDPSLIFSPNEIQGIQVTKISKDFIEVQCGCTHKRYGDSGGKLRVYPTGRLEISCKCCPDCKEDNIRPSEFEKHAGLKGLSNWKNRIWVFVNDSKVPLSKTKLLKYYKGSASDPSASVRPRRTRTVHRDELIACVKCGKERRFSRQSEDECKAYHLAECHSSWTCSDFPYQRLKCSDEEERGSKKRFRGCPSRPVCKGCTSCVCFGCAMCRFQDCSCRSCVDFFLNSEP